MKRIISIATLVMLIGSAANSQTQFDTLKDTLTTFTTIMARSLALGSSTGSTWSDAFLDGFPHLGVGLAVGASFTGKGTIAPLFTAFQQTAPAALDTLGLPIPSAALTAKLGLPFIPIDIGISGGFIPAAVQAQLKTSLGITLDYLNFGAQVRIGLVKESLFLPDISVGVGGRYQSGTISTPLRAGPTTIADTILPVVGTHWLVQASDPALALAWKSMTYDGTLQISKSLLLVRPFVGVGLTLGSSTVTGGVASTLSFTRDNVASDAATLSNEITAAGGTPPEFSNAGYLYSTKVDTPVFRVYGGVSIELLILILDGQVIYAPVTNTLGASITARLQI